ncbi:MAG: hypothetical protein FWG22_04865 [Prolixibacteraceae bacterium]|nr:hypothetical protein [Prolixibacteraceae bacterium]
MGENDSQKEISLLKKQLDLLDKNKFDLEDWKNQTLIFLERIFGKEDSKVRLVRDLRYDYSSWNLRDTAGVAGTSKDPVKSQAAAILEAAIEELETLGLPSRKNDALKVRELLSDELTGKQMKQINSILQTESNNRIEDISNILEEIETESLAKILAKLLIS